MGRVLPRCYFLTFSTYGSHLLGDERGSVRWGGTPVPPNAALKGYMTDHLNAGPIKMEFEERAVVHDAIIESAYRRKFLIDALNVRRTHIHLVVCTLNGLSEMDVMSAIKYDAGLALKPFVKNQVGEHIWSKSFAKTEIFSIGAWRALVNYTFMEQGSNVYMAQTKFARRTKLTSFNDMSALYAAFGLRKTRVYVGIYFPRRRIEIMTIWTKRYNMRGMRL